MKAFAATLLLMLAAAPAQAQAPPRETLPLGLDHFYWGMEFTEAQTFFGEIGGRIPLPFRADMNHAWIHFAPYSWKTCVINADLYFSGSGKLDHIELLLGDAQKQTPSCRSDILTELRTYYGLEKTTGTQLSFHDSSPDAPGISIRLDMTGAEPLAAVDVIDVDRTAIDHTGEDQLRAASDAILRDLAPPGVKP